MQIPTAHLDIDRLQHLLDVIDAHVRAKRLNDAREALREAQAVKRRIEDRLAIEASLQRRYNRAMH